MAHTFQPSTQEAAAGGSLRVQGQPGLHVQCYTENPCFIKLKTKNQLVITAPMWSVLWQSSDFSWFQSVYWAYSQLCGLILSLAWLKHLMGNNFPPCISLPSLGTLNCTQHVLLAVASLQVGLRYTVLSIGSTPCYCSAHSPYSALKKKKSVFCLKTKEIFSVLRWIPHSGLKRNQMDTHVVTVGEK